MLSGGQLQANGLVSHRISAIRRVVLHHLRYNRFIEISSLIFQQLGLLDLIQWNEENQEQDACGKQASRSP